VLAVSLAAVLAILAVVVLVVVIRRVHATRQVISVDDQQPIASDGPSRRSMTSWGFDSVRSKYSISNEAAVHDPSS